MDIKSNCEEFLKSIQDPHVAGEARRLVHEINLLFKEISWELPAYYEEVAKKELEIDSKNMSRDELICRLAHSQLVEEADSVANAALNKHCEALEKTIQLMSVLWKNSDETIRHGTAKYVEVVLMKGFDEGKRYQMGAIAKNYAVANAKKKLAKDPKQVAKKFVFECWQAWQAEPALYKNQSSFARDMLDKFVELRSQSVVEGWCRKWKTSVS